VALAAPLLEALRHPAHAAAGAIVGGGGGGQHRPRPRAKALAGGVAHEELELLLREARRGGGALADEQLGAHAVQLRCDVGVRAQVLAA
jgi:hypothetical protein